MCQTCQWADTLDKLDEMLASNQFTFANDFLSSVRSWIEEKEHVTPKQLAGINNVANAVGKRRNHR